MFKNYLKQNKKLIIQGFVLSSLLLTLAYILYSLNYNHASSVDTVFYNFKIAIIDDNIPVVPIFFFGYNLSFIFWFFAPFLIVKSGKKKTMFFILNFLVTLIICNLILYMFPSKIDRVLEGLYNTNYNSFGWKLLNIVYKVDGGTIEYNLLPSTHCANSVVYYQALKDDKIPVKYRKIGHVCAIIVTISTLLIKQHYFLDSVVGVLIPLIVRFILDKLLKGKYYEDN